MLIQANFLNGRIFPSTLEDVDYALKTLKPKSYLAVAGSDSTEFIRSKVVETLGKFKIQVNIFCPECRSDIFILKK